MRSPMALAIILTVGIATAPALVGQDGVKHLDIEIADGATLKATYYDPGAPGPGVMLFHQCNRDRKSWIELATKLAGEGIHVLTLDNRGYGESTGGSGDGPNRDLPRDEVQGMQGKWETDIESTFQAFVAMEGVDSNRLGAGGASCGVHNAIRLASHHPEFRTLVLLSGGTRPEQMEFIKSANEVSLFGAASEEDGGTPERMHGIIDASPNSDSKLVMYNNAGHGVPMFDAEPELLPMVAKWFADHLQ